MRSSSHTACGKLFGRFRVVERTSEKSCVCAKAASLRDQCKWGRLGMHSGYRADREQCAVAGFSLRAPFNFVGLAIVFIV